MMEKKQKDCCATGLSGKILVASLFILCGILLLARNVGWITDELFHIIVSWYSLFIVLGVYSLLRRHFVAGVVLLLVGVYFLLGGLLWLPAVSQVTVWPVILIVVGILLFIRPRLCSQRNRMKQGDWNFTDECCQSESVDGFLRSDNKFGAARHVVLDELFKGASAHVSFGGTVIDLRHTHIAPGETYIDLDCSWGGIEIYVPSDWRVVFRCNAFFGGCDDKRWQNGNVNKESILVIRGKLSFGGLEVKD